MRKEGKKNGVVRIAYLAPFCPVENVSLIEAFGGHEPEFYDVQVRFPIHKSAPGHSNDAVKTRYKY